LASTAADTTSKFHCSRKHDPIITCWNQDGRWKVAVHLLRRRKRGKRCNCCHLSCGVIIVVVVETNDNWYIIEISAVKGDTHDC